MVEAINPIDNGVKNCQRCQNVYQGEHTLCKPCIEKELGYGLENCAEHGNEFIDYKCNYCCSIGLFVIEGGRKILCQPCFNDQMEKKLKIKTQCAGGPRCPLGLSKHPKADKKFALGCAICRSTKMEIIEQTNNEGFNVEKRADLLAKHGNPNNEQELAALMGVAANAPNPGMMHGMKGKKGKKGAGAAPRRAEEQKVDQEEEYKFQQAENFVDTDTECNICYKEKVDPCILPCKHSFCSCCISEFFKYKRECAMCRMVPPANFVVRANNTRPAQAQAAAQAQQQSTEINVKLTYGNRHEIVQSKNPNNCHKWTAFVRLESNQIDTKGLIEKVRFGLNPTFGVAHREIKANPDGKFEITFTGSEPISIPITITYKRGGLTAERQMNLEHMVNFEGNGQWQTIDVPINRQQAQVAGLFNRIKKRFGY